MGVAYGTFPQRKVKDKTGGRFKILNAGCASGKLLYIHGQTGNERGFAGYLISALLTPNAYAGNATHAGKCCLFVTRSILLLPAGNDTLKMPVKRFRIRITLVCMYLEDIVLPPFTIHYSLAVGEEEEYVSRLREEGLLANCYTAFI